jgi:hypothetical protein
VKKEIEGDKKIWEEDKKETKFSILLMRVHNSGEY